LFAKASERLSSKETTIDTAIDQWQRLLSGVSCSGTELLNTYVTAAMEDNDEQIVSQTHLQPTS